MHEGVLKSQRSQSTVVSRSLSLHRSAEQLLSDLESGAMNSVGHIRLTEPAAGISAARWDQQLNSYLFGANLQGLCTPRLQEGIPYQSMISSVLHKYE
jgi:hypothetical protein